MAETEGESFETCAIKGDGDDLHGVSSATIDGLDEFRAEFEDILADYDQPGITVDEVDGQWYVSPIATYFDQFFAVTPRPRSRGDRAGDRGDRELFSSAEEVIVDEYDDLSGDARGRPGEHDRRRRRRHLATPVDRRHRRHDSVRRRRCPRPTRSTRSASLPTAAEAAACMQGHVDSGTMPDYYMPIELQVPRVRRRRCRCSASCPSTR